MQQSDWSRIRGARKNQQNHKNKKSSNHRKTPRPLTFPLVFFCFLFFVFDLRHRRGLQLSRASSLHEVPGRAWHQSSHLHLACGGQVWSLSDRGQPRCHACLDCSPQPHGQPERWHPSRDDKHEGVGWKPSSPRLIQPPMRNWASSGVAGWPRPISNIADNAASVLGMVNAAGASLARALNTLQSSWVVLS